MNEPLKFSRQPDLRNPSLIVGWGLDAGKLGAKVMDYLNKKLGGQSFCEIEPLDFFLFDGVAVEDDLVQFPESKIYACSESDLVVFKGVPPGRDWYKYLNLILDAAEHYCNVKEMYTIGGMVSPRAHTAPRELRGTFNSPELRDTLDHYNLNRGTDYETPPGQRPTLNSFLLWVAKRRNIPGVSLWVPVPFYLVAVDDPGAQKKALEFFNQRFDLNIDFSDLDEEIRRQNQMIDEVRSSFPDIDEPLKRLESNLRPSDKENQKLAEEIEKFLKERKG